MILNNVKIGFRSYHNNTNEKLININGSATGGYISSGGASFTQSITGMNANPPANLLTLSAGYSILDIGFGNTPESASDYVLADGNAQNQCLTVVSYGKNTAALGEILNNYLNVRNDGGSNVTVTEIGFYGDCTGSSSTAGNNTSLLYRKVLETPVTIAPGETYSFNYVIRFKS